MRESNIEIDLERVKRNDEHATILYELLKQRKHRISHKSLPSFEEHKSFVISHPYRIWFLIRTSDRYVGSIYAYKNNGIGISVNFGKEKFIEPAISLFLKINKPLKPIKSVRSAEFGVYAAPTDKKLISILESMGGHFAQVTYLFK
jgi:hypothetical protein